MDLSNVFLETNELIFIDGIYIYRNEYAYLIFKRCISEPCQESSLFFNGAFYCVKTVQDLRSYKTEDFT